jgi:uncharacterized protein with HEPN domain
MNESSLIRIRHMLEAAQQTQQFIAGRRRDDLDRDKMLTFALVKAIEIIGEAAVNVDAQTQAETAQIPWRQIAGMRNRLVHAYFDIDC